MPQRTSKESPTVVSIQLSERSKNVVPLFLPNIFRDHLSLLRDPLEKDCPPSLRHWVPLPSPCPSHRAPPRASMVASRRSNRAPSVSPTCPLCSAGSEACSSSPWHRTPLPQVGRKRIWGSMDSWGSPPKPWFRA